MIVKELTPITNGQLRFGAPSFLAIDEITEAEDPDHVLHYEKDEEGNEVLYKNFMLTYTVCNAEGYPMSVEAIGSSNDLIRLFGLFPERADAIWDYLMNKLHTEIPFQAFITKDDDVDPKTGKESQYVYFNCMLHSLLDSGEPMDVDPESPTYKNVLEMIEKDVYARNTLAKLANMLEQGYNEAHYDAKAIEIAKAITEARVLDAAGHFAPLTLIGVDNLLNSAKGRVLVNNSVNDK